MRRTNAFTLIELLVTLLIVSLLVALVFGGIHATLAKAAAAQAQNHLREMGSALFSHVAENNGCLVDGALSPSLAAGGLLSSRGPAVAYWFNALDFYMGGKDYTVAGMQTPQRPTWQRDPLKPYPSWGTVNGYGISVGFGWNHQYFGYDSLNVGYGWRSRMSEVRYPSKTIIIGTGEDSLNDGNAVRNVMIYANSIRCLRYNGGGYYLFLDGHTENLTPAQVMDNNSYLMKKTK